jgi:hypothetical protein
MGFTITTRYVARLGDLKASLTNTQNGLSDHSKEPTRIKDVHALEINFISEWIAQFKEEKGKK